MSYTYDLMTGRRLTPPPTPTPEEPIMMEIREIEVADAPSEMNEPEPGWSIGIPNEKIEIIRDFVSEKLEDAPKVRCHTNDIYEVFDKWITENKVAWGDDNHFLWSYMKEHYEKKGMFYIGCKLNTEDDERLKKEKMMKLGRMKTVVPVRGLLDSDEEPEPKEKFELKDIIESCGKTIHRHPDYMGYGGDLETGEIFRLSNNQISKIVTASVDKGIVLSLGYDEDGKRKQQYISSHKFIAECGKLKRDTKNHTKLKINMNCDVYKNRPKIEFYPLGCLSYEYDGTPHADITKPMSVSELISKCSFKRQIDDYMAEMKTQYKAELKKKDDEIRKLQERIDKLETENGKLNKPLNAGALQLQHLLMSEVDGGETVMNMLQYCFKDIVRDYPKDEVTESDDDAENYIFGQMSPRGLPYDNEHITR
jgi:hypothetical protein